MKKIIVTFCDDDSEAVNVSIKDEDRITKRNRITMDSFVEALLESQKTNEDFIPLGSMPEGYVTGAMSQSYPDHRRVTLQLPAARRPVLYYGKLYNLPYPSLVFHFETGKNGNITHSKCYAAGNSRITEGSSLYKYPFGNVYDSAKICWGNIVLPRIESFADFEKLLPLFFGAETNDDLWSSSNVNCDVKTQRELLEALSKKEIFPAEWLVLQTTFAENLS